MIEVSDDLLTSFEEEGFIYLCCTYIASPKFIGDWWVNIHQISYLRGGKGDKYSTCTKETLLKKIGDNLQFVLIFSAVPKHF